MMKWCGVWFPPRRPIPLERGDYSRSRFTATPCTPSPPMVVGESILARIAPFLRARLAASGPVLVGFARSTRTTTRARGELHELDDITGAVNDLPPSPSPELRVNQEE
jgi:hypothetical protein